MLCENDESMYFFRFNDNKLIKGIQITSKSIRSINTMAIFGNDLFLGGSLNENPIQGFIHKNYYTLNETIPGMMFNFTNSTIDLKASNGYVFETESNIPIDWFSSSCNDDYSITGIEETS